MQNPTKPPFLAKVQEKMRCYYGAPDVYLCRLKYTNGNARQRRSRRREAHLAAPHVLIDYLDLDTLSATVSQTFLSQCTTFGKKRLYRALKDLQDAGYIRRFSKSLKEDGNWVTYRKIKFHPTFFHDLKIEKHELLRNQDLKRRSMHKQKVEQKIELQSPEQKEDCQANRVRLAQLIREALNGGAAPKVIEKPVEKCKLPPPTGDPPKLLSRHRLANSTSQAERENYADRRLALFRQLRETMSFEEAKIKADEKFPPLA